MNKLANGSTIGADLVADITTILSEVKLVPPEDYSGTTTITTSVTSTKVDAQESQPATNNFDLTVSAVAEVPVVTASVATSATQQEDTDAELDLKANIQDKDGSETLSQVRISGLTSIGDQNLTGVLVDEMETLLDLVMDQVQPYYQQQNIMHQKWKSYSSDHLLIIVVP